MELHWQSRVLSKSPVLKKFQLSTPNTDGVWAVDISCVHPTLSVVSSFDYNSTEWFFNHPRHGVIPCALADRNISQDEELFLHYGYDPNNCPDWYKSAVQQYLSQHSDLDLWQVVDPNRLVC